MKRIFLALTMVLLLSELCFARYVEIPPTNPNCKDSEIQFCMQSCSTTLLNCGGYETGKFIDGKFVKEINNDWDCNTTTCVWNCTCAQKSN